MPVYRTPDDRIVEEKTTRPPLTQGKAPGREAGAEEATVFRPTGGRAPAAPTPRPRGYDAPTLVRSPVGSTAPQEPVGKPDAPAPDSERTQLHGDIGARSAAGDAAAPAVHPVAGWLVVIEGPGAGHDLRIRVGWNRVGRDPENDIALAFGDNRISRRDHFRVIYDPEGRVFSVAPGEGSNVWYLNGSGILGPRSLATGDTIRVGRTTLRFVAFCGDGFHWPDVDEAS